MKFLITNSVPLNGGDEALLRALLLSLTRRWPESEITVLCHDLERCRKQLPDLRLGFDLEFAKTKEARRNTIDAYRAADVVISAPGGFLHDHYAIENRLRGFELALKFSKPVVLLAQSIGPFWKPRSIRRVRKVLNRVSAICLRDEISCQYLAQCGVSSTRIKVTADIAFLWHQLAPELFHPAQDAKARTIGLCFRVWPLDDQVVLQETISKAAQLCERLLSDPERRLVFLSTCQGIPGYIDDSKVAAQIRDRLSPELQQRCEVDASRYPPTELVQALGRCDAFVGMRLHACLLSMLAGVPAMGLGYEDKTEQIFRQMGLESYQTRFDSDLNSWLSTADRFFASLGEIRSGLAQKLAERCLAAEENIAAVANQLTPAKEIQKVSTEQQITTEERWTEAVKRYGRPHLRLRQVAALVNQLKPKRMLDVGCATGHLRTLCPGVEYVGCDFIPPTPPIDFSFYQCNFNRDPLPAELAGFDVVVCSGILEYIEDVPAFLTALRSKLKPGGHLIVTYFNMHHISRVPAMINGHSAHSHPDWRGFHSIGGFQKLLQKSGFSIARSIPMNHSFGKPENVEAMVSAPLKLPRSHWWSTLLAHQFLFVVKPT